MKDLYKAFQKFGLVESQIKLYLSLLQNRGEYSPASAIALRNDFDRNTTRHNCDQLVKRGLVKCKREGNTYLYTAEPPERVMDLIDREEEKVVEWKKSFQRNMSYLKKLMNPESLIPGAEFYYGFEGVQKIYEDTIKEEVDMIYAYENIEFMPEKMKKYILEDYIPRRAKKNIFIKVLSPDNEMHRKTQKDDKEFCRETRFISGSEFELQIEINVYGKKSAFFSYREDEMFAIIIESEAIANSMKAIFMDRWESLTEK